jgi:hypothetical protein
MSGLLSRKAFSVRHGWLEQVTCPLARTIGLSVCGIESGRILICSKISCLSLSASVHVDGLGANARLILKMGLFKFIRTKASFGAY